MSSAPGRREVAQRVFAAEYDEATVSYSESDEERAPNYVVTPTGARVNRLFFVGVLTEVEQVGDDVLRARIVDPTGAFVVYAGQYQPDEMAFLQKAQPPAFVAVTGKARTFSPDDSDRVYTSVRPESITEVDAETRDRWSVNTAEHTIARVVTFATALESGQTGDALQNTLAANGVEEGFASGVALALEHYGTTAHYLASVGDLSLDVLRVVAGEKDEVDSLAVMPSDAGDRTVDRERLASTTELAVSSLDVQPEPAGTGMAADAMATAESTEADTADGDSADATAADRGPGETTETAADPEPADTEPADSAETAAGSASADTAEAATEPEPADAADVETETTADVETETTADVETEESTVASDSDDDIGDFEPGSSLGDEDEDAGEPVADVSEPETESATDESEPEVETATDDVLDEEERERIEAEYGTDFQTGTEVGDAGEAGIEPENGEPIGPEAEEDAEAETATDEPVETAAAESADAAEADAAEGAADDAAETDASEDTAEAAEDVDLDAVVIEQMEALDDGDGADRAELVSVVASEYGVDADTVEDAVQDALMGGQCYEPADGKLKPI